MPCQWSPGDLLQVLMIWEGVFYSQAFFTLHHCIFQGFLRFGSSTSKSGGLHADLRNIVPAQLFVWITTIHRRFGIGRFCLRSRVAQSRSINFYRGLVLQNISFEISASYGVWTFFEIVGYVINLMFYLFGHKVLQTVIH